jgi:hypothetical protein
MIYRHSKVNIMILYVFQIITLIHHIYYKNEYNHHIRPYTLAE